jgi:hypothetical protein
MVVVGLSISVLIWLLSAIFGVQFGGIGENLFALIISMVGAYIGGLYWAARGRPLAAEPGRGAMVLDGVTAQVATQQLRKQALAKPDTRSPSPASPSPPRMKSSTSNSWGQPDRVRARRSGSSCMRRCTEAIGR